ncbi:hypothetical protein CNY89_27485, partial [Amaricoccus sp. HAR-UPW-R2A-40]
GEVCPLWPGHPTSAHWGIEDPAAVEGPEFRKRAAFDDALTYMRNRISAFINLPIASIDRLALKAKLQAIARWTAPPLRNRKSRSMSVFERYLTVW